MAALFGLKYMYNHVVLTDLGDWLGDPVEMRYKESQERGTVIGQLGYCVNNYREAAVSNDPKFDHIDLEEKQKVI